MIDHANELRRHARKIPHPQGETSGVMLRAADEIECLRAKIAAMEKQEPIGTAHAMPGASAFTMACFDVQDIPVGAKLYALPGTHPKLESSVPEGWKLVPIEPTAEIRKAMHYAYWKSPQLPYHDGSPELWNAAYAALLAAAPEAKPSVPDGWKEAAIAWEVCGSLHREYAKGKDPFFKKRQEDFVKHANDARAMIAAAPEAKP